MEFYGRGFVSDPWGKILTEGKRNEEDLILAELDLNEIKRARDILQFHRDKRIDSYNELLRLSRKVVGATVSRLTVARSADYDFLRRWAHS